jgi:pyridoxal phosphate enzyme (YggS family)
VLSESLARIEGRIQQAAHRAGRPRDQITLVAVTKTFPAAVTREAYALGLRHFGENYIQEFERKVPELAGLSEARFHFLGHLQSNKVRLASELFHAIDSLDSDKLARKINDIGIQQNVMIEVRLGNEASKSGVDPEALPALVDAVRACSNLTLRGLMTMPPFADDPEESRPYFRQLHRLAGRHGLSCLSMGMSQDFEVAIEEGATQVRIGTALFGLRQKA